MGLEDVPRCQHVKMNGTQCGSPALRRRRHCFFHERIRRERAKIAASAQHGFDLPLLEDANSVQVALMKVIQMLGSGRLDHKTAGLMLYALQTASTNLRNATFEVDDATDVVIDRDDVHRTTLDGPQWFEEDFEAEDGSDEEANQANNEEAHNEEADAQEAEDDVEQKVEQENVVVAAQVENAAPKKQVAAVKQPTADYDAERSIAEFQQLSGQGHSQGARLNREEIHRRP
jgi:hypothetical protein